MKFLASSAKLLPVLLLVCGFSARASAQVTWTLNDVTFTNGNTASGIFTTNSDVSGFLSFSLTVSGSDSAAAFTATQMDAAVLPNIVGFANSDFSEYVALFTASPLTNAGGTIALVNPSLTLQSVDCPGCGVLIINSDTELIGVTPEPPSGRLMLAGVVLLTGAWFLRRGWRQITTKS